MPEEVDVAKEEVLNEDVLDGVAKPEQEESSPSKEVSQEKTGEVEKTEEEVASAETPEPDDMADLKEGQSIPYERFKKVIEQKNKFKTDYDGVQTELEEARGYIQNPDVYRAILLSKGITDKKLQNEKLVEAGFEVKEEPPPIGEVYKSFTQGLDLNTQEGWLKAMERMTKHFGKEMVAPFEQKLTQADREKWVAKEEMKAKKTAEKYKLVYGKVGIDEKNPNTAVGMMMGYIRKNPEDARLGHDKILKLALEEKGFELGKMTGLDEAKKRNQALKDSQMEDDTMQTREGEADSNWSAEDLMKYARKNPDKI